MSSVLSRHLLFNTHHLQALAHSSGYDSTDEEDGLEPHHRGQGGLRGARSEEFLDRGHLEQDLRRPSTRSDLTYHTMASC